MKISKTILGIVGMGIFTIVAVVLGMGSLRQADERKQLQEQLAASQTRLQNVRLEPLLTQRADLEKQLNEATPQFESVKAKLAEPATSTIAAAAVFNSAAAQGLTVDELKSTDPADEKVTGINLSAVSVTSWFTGSPTNVISFVRELNSLLKTGAIKAIEITVPATGDNTTGRVSGNTTTKVELTVYTYEGDR